MTFKTIIAAAFVFILTGLVISTAAWQLKTYPVKAVRINPDGKTTATLDKIEAPATATLGLRWGWWSTE